MNKNGAWLSAYSAPASSPNTCHYPCLGVCGSGLNCLQQIWKDTISPQDLYHFTLVHEFKFLHEFCEGYDCRQVVFLHFFDESSEGKDLCYICALLSAYIGCIYILGQWLS